ncbi:MAG: capsular biosynthesis protein [Bacteroidetes bacterium HGW-Bacteroidetes-19]|nr:MAG: capsular biosynthesis protein [Bacteroidetes bacterium HGW-Bacteroidetes-20]PKP28662.1 MAG: capsular biosynthesis protein [Bacteroidetes bacterium HGW-Bacteroidetes-19]
MKNVIPFCLPFIDKDVIDEVNDTLTNTGWLTTGPKVKSLEEEIKKLTKSEATLCVNSWTSGAMLILKWFGVGIGDEVIIPAYTYSATALAVLNLGATPIMIDVKKDSYLIDVDKIREKITEKTKVIMPVDLAGMPCDYDSIFSIVNDEKIKSNFHPNSERQKKLGRILILADAAHSLGAVYKGIEVGRVADITVFSLHSVKNITTGEGGAICLNLPKPFHNDEEYTFLKSFSLNGQSKSAFEKNQPGSWKYDIIDQGLKVNMPDICAAIGLAQIKKYSSILLPIRKSIYNFYQQYFSKFDWAICPQNIDQNTESSCHLYLLRIKGISESIRDNMILEISKEGIGVNVHYIPMAMMTLFKNLKYNIDDYPNTYQQYCNTISLPIYNGLSSEQLNRVANAVINAYNHSKLKEL